MQVEVRRHDPGHHVIETVLRHATVSDGAEKMLAKVMRARQCADIARHLKVKASVGELGSAMRRMPVRDDIARECQIVP